MLLGNSLSMMPFSFFNRKENITISFRLSLEHLLLESPLSMMSMLYKAALIQEKDRSSDIFIFLIV